MDLPRPLRILIVEDEGMIAMDIEGTVEDEGHIAVGWATSADEAIRLYETSKPDIVFLDVQLLHGTSGIDVARNLRTRTGARYVFMTANPSKIEEDLIGGIGVLTKPFSNAKLVSTLRYLHQGVLAPPPTIARPAGLKLGPDYATWP